MVLHSYLWKIFIYLFIYIFLLYNSVLVLPYINMNLPRVYISSHSWTPLPPLSPFHPSGLSQCSSPEHPVSCIEPRLAIHFLYDIIHVSMPFSQIIPPSPFPTESKRLFYTSVSLLLSRIQGYYYHLSKFHTPMFITALFMIARTWKQLRCPSADEWLRKLWYVYTMEYYSAIKKNTFESVLMRWMKLEPIINSEVSQKEKQYSILTHIYGI